MLWLCPDRRKEAFEADHRDLLRQQREAAFLLALKVRDLATMKPLARQMGIPPDLLEEASRASEVFGRTLSANPVAPSTIALVLLRQ